MTQHTIQLARLEHIMSFCSSWRCGDTQDFIASALSNNWDDETLTNPKLNQYYNKHWMTNICYGEYVTEELIDDILMRLNECDDRRGLRWL